MKQVSHTTAILITVFLGPFGIHRFMVGRGGTGLIWLLTYGVFGIGWIIDIIAVVNYRFLTNDEIPWGA